MARKMKSMDGNTAAAHVAYAFTDVASIFPITPSSPMAEYMDSWSANGRKNLFGQTVDVVEMQSEAGASGAVHGSLAAGALTSTFTASQGLLLMIPNMYKIAGELLPGVFHVSARAVAAHALSIFGDHSDVMATRQTGFALLASGGIQEVMDLAAVAHLSAIEGRIPFVHFFDGFRSSHEIQKIEIYTDDELRSMLDFDAVKKFRDNALNPDHPKIMGTAQNPDIFFQAKESVNRFYDQLPSVVERSMEKISAITGRNYHLFDYYGAPDADRIIIAMGSVTETMEETTDYLLQKGEKVGILKVRLYRPFSVAHFLQVLPKSVKKIAVLDRTKEPGSIGEPLYLDIRNVFYQKPDSPIIVGGRYGLGSKDTTPSQIKAVFDNLLSDTPKDRFTIGIEDDVTYMSLPIKDRIVSAPKENIRCKFWGLGSDGTVGANKNAIKIIGDNTNLYAQGYFAYDSKKSGGVTISHLRFGKKPIKSTYLIDEADYIACHNQSYISQYDVLEGLKTNGTFVLNCMWSEKELEEHLPNAVKSYLANHNIDFYTIDATKIAEDIGLGNRINMIMQAAFFKLSKVLPLDEAIKLLKDAIQKSYGSKGEDIVRMNFKAVDAGIDNLQKINVPDSWKNLSKDEAAVSKNVPAFIHEILQPMNQQKGDILPVSAFVGRENGEFPCGTSAYEKRGIAINVPHWLPENCIQCNQCSFVCPHAAIRPFLLNEHEKNSAPEKFRTISAKGKDLDSFHFVIQVDPLDCTGCGNCADICPSKEKSLIMKPLDTQIDQQKNFDWAVSTVSEKTEAIDNINTIKGSQFIQPLFEFSGACAGCGETPYAKLATQLFGDRMLIANATGCSSIWGASAPSIPFCKNALGKGPAWANSLFEDNAEYGFGMLLAVDQIRNFLKTIMEEAIQLGIGNHEKTILQNWIQSKENSQASKKASMDVMSLFKQSYAGRLQEIMTEIQNRKDFLVKRSVWSWGGDGWAYDIGYGGLDHVLASGRDINILVFDTEVYSNTGGQSSKSTPEAAVAKFAASGKRTKKKDLGRMLMAYGYVYVAQVAMGANKNQLIKAFTEAEAYPGPSLIIAYSPCINHGLTLGMGKTQEQEKRAVDAGYWHLYRYNPTLKQEGKNPFVLDSKEPTADFQEFIRSEVRYTSLEKSFPEIAPELFKKAEEDAKERYEAYRMMAEGCI
ncbi:MAG TPA: pyruvate:ferredoxin (flavodoxin) oxidoreductase [Caldisericia bacterium]|nr:pyruvate:ferredoxin (flavodoxin) oxidoreductase [Caldisericia bacterium]